jgi:hypothetical protein
MICSSVNRLLFRSVTVLVDGRPKLEAGTAGGGQVNGAAVMSKHQQPLHTRI